MAERDARDILWNRVGEQLVPPATGAQCRKHYENMRTRVGKILKKERKSGAGQPERSARDDEIMETWGFLTQHIVRGKTLPSEQFAIPESAAVASSDDAGDESGLQSPGARLLLPRTRRSGPGLQQPPSLPLHRRSFTLTSARLSGR